MIGDSFEVRVSDVRYIKGLQFETVLFVGIDGLSIVCLISSNASSTSERSVPPYT